MLEVREVVPDFGEGSLGENDEAQFYHFTVYIIRNIYIYIYSIYSNIYSSIRKYTQKYSILSLFQILSDILIDGLLNGQERMLSRIYKIIVKLLVFTVRNIQQIYINYSSTFHKSMSTRFPLPPIPLQIISQSSLNPQNQPIQNNQTVVNKQPIQMIQLESEQFMDCPICYTTKNRQSFYEIFECEHRFCQQCLTSLKKQCLQSYRVMACPECDAGLANINISIHTIMLEKQWKQFKRMDFNKQIMSSQHLKLCPNQDCEFGSIETTDKQKTGKCSKCDTSYCLKCMLPSHRGNCLQKNKTHLKSRYQYQQCPKCQQYVERSSGCPQITCRCANVFCYYCGANWLGTHQCWRIAFDGKLLVTDKIERISSYCRPENCILGSIPFVIIYIMLLTLWILWVTFWLVVGLSLTAAATLIGGYPFVIKKNIQFFDRSIANKLVLIFSILLAPVAYPFWGVFLFIWLLKTRFHHNFYYPTVVGELYPFLRCQII